MSAADLDSGLKDVLLAALGEQYHSVSPQDGIITGNHYQSVTLGDQRTTGFRTDRERILDRIDFEGRKVLDLGSNLGELSRAARARGARLVDGFEYDPYFVRIANLINALNGVTRVSFEQRDIADLEAYDQPYDIVLAFAVFAYVSAAMPRIARNTDVLVFETHKLDGDFEEHYVRPVSEHFPVHRVISASDWGMEGDRRAIRAVIVFAKDAGILDSVLKPRAGADHATGAAAAPEPEPDMRLLDVQRTCLQRGFFDAFAFDSPADLVAAVEGMRIDVETIARSLDARKLVYSGWVYWFLYLKGFLDYRETGNQGPGNVFYDYLTGHYGEGGDNSADPGVKHYLARPADAAEVVRRRFRDMEIFQGGRADEAGAVAPLRVYPAEHEDATAHQVFERGRPAPLLARGIDGWHRLFAARVFGAEALPAAVMRASAETSLRGAIEELDFRGETLRLRGWCASAAGPLDAVEVRVRRLGELGIARLERKPDGVVGFEFEGTVGRRDDRQLRIAVVGLRDWEPVGVLNARYLPEMRDVPGDARLRAVRGATILDEMLEPIRRWRAPGRFRSVLDWGCGDGLLEQFMPRFIPNASVTAVDRDAEGIDRPLPVEDVDLVLGHAVLPRLDRAGQASWLPALARAMQSGGYAALTLRGELLRPFVTEPDVLADLERDGICDRAGPAGTMQTRAFTEEICADLFDVLAYVEGGVGGEHDLIVLRKP